MIDTTLITFCLQPLRAIVSRFFLDFCKMHNSSRISRPCDEKGNARAFVDNRKDRRKKKQRSSKNKYTRRYIAAWLGRSTAEMFVDARDREKWKGMIAYDCNRHGN